MPETSVAPGGCLSGNAVRKLMWKSCFLGFGLDDLESFVSAEGERD